ncbi:MAG: menaquinol oxidoreductase [Deltaproteobacteria bacterium]|nr:MAG: menaquinol oxidoreductase [Deltaproteobacteria bacterium]
MYHKKFVITGLVIFLGLFTYPLWSNMGGAKAKPEPVLSETAKKAGSCVRDKAYMTRKHMQLLDVWRDTVVRKGERMYTSPDNGKTYNMSLSTGKESCLGCHTSKAEFCDRCHDYASVRPYCWDCHTVLEEKK